MSSLLVPEGIFRSVQWSTESDRPLAILRPERRHDATAIRGLITPGALPAPGAAPHPHSPACSYGGLSTPPGGLGCASAVDGYAGIRTARSCWQPGAFGRPARQSRRRPLLGELVTHLPRRDALRAEGARRLSGQGGGGRGRVCRR